MIRFVVVTDCHLGPEATFDGKLRKLSAEAPRLLDEALTRRLAAGHVVDFLVNLGDVVEDEDHEADLARYRQFVAMMDRPGLDVVHVAGNHDEKNLAPTDLLKLWGRSEDRLYRSFDRGGVHFVVLNTHERTDRDVTIDDAQLVWLERDLATGQAPVVVLMHHSAAEQDLGNNRWFSKAPHLCLVKRRKRLRALLAKSERVVLVLNGHLHWNQVSLHDGIPYVTLQSLVENVEDDAPGRPAAASTLVEVSTRCVTVAVDGAHPMHLRFERPVRPAKTAT